MKHYHFNKISQFITLSYTKNTLFAGGRGKEKQKFKVKNLDNQYFITIKSNKQENFYKIKKLEKF